MTKVTTTLNRRDVPAYNSTNQSTWEMLKFTWFGLPFESMYDSAVILCDVSSNMDPPMSVDRVHHICHMSGNFQAYTRRVFETTLASLQNASFTQSRSVYIILLRLFCKLHSSVDQPRCADEVREILQANLDHVDYNRLWLMMLAFRSGPSHLFQIDALSYGCTANHRTWRKWLTKILDISNVRTS